MQPPVEPKTQALLWLHASSLAHNDNFCLEAPWFLYKNGYHYLFYSANWYDSPDYYTGVARSASGFLGPYVRMDQSFLQVDKVIFQPK